MNLDYSILQQREQIQLISGEKKAIRLQQEQQHLNRLKAQENGYLNQYDQLFRYVNLALLDAGYDLTNHQPHQVLKAVCLQYGSVSEVNEMVQHRHALKKRITFDVLPTAQQTLTLCVQALKALQACNH